jgi:hypothetical protein
MLRIKSRITIRQVPTKTYPQRNRGLSFDFMTEFECKDNWADLTNTATVTIPKNVRYQNADGSLINLGSGNSNIGGFGPGEPLFLKGDEVTIAAGYEYSARQKLFSADLSVPLFKGYIASISAKKPIELRCEDNMYRLKQLPALNQVYLQGHYTVESMLAHMLQGTGLTVNQLTKTSVGDFRTQNETVCEVLERLRADYHLEAYFRGDELRCGSLVYLEAEAKTQVFTFQETIIADDLVYKRKDDVVLSAVAHSVNKLAVAGGKTKDGHAKTKTERLEVLITFKDGDFTVTHKKPGDTADFTPPETGERRTFDFTGITTEQDLIDRAEAELKKYYYDGYHGKFTTFGMPFVKHGDNARLVDNLLPERNGVYKIKSVERKLSVDGGLRQVIELDYKIGANAIN